MEKIEKIEVLMTGLEYKNVFVTGFTLFYFIQ